MTLIKEFRIPNPLSTAEYQIGQLYAVAEASAAETGGGEGVEILKNEPFVDEKNGTKGQYTLKRYYLESKVPAVIKKIAPTGSLILTEEAWNAYPYCRTVLKNEYMKDSFRLEVISKHLDDDTGEKHNVHDLKPDELKARDIVKIDIVTDPISAKFKVDPNENPAIAKSEKAGRGPLAAGWQSSTKPIMCCYKLVHIRFKWMGLQSIVESSIANIMQGVFTKFHRELFCWMDRWFGMTMEDIRALEEKTQRDLDERRKQGGVVTTMEAS